MFASGPSMGSPLRAGEQVLSSTRLFAFVPSVSSFLQSAAPVELAMRVLVRWSVPLSFQTAACEALALPEMVTLIKVAVPKFPLSMAPPPALVAVFSASVLFVTLREARLEIPPPPKVAVLPLSVLAVTVAVQ